MSYQVIWDKNAGNQQGELPTPTQGGTLEPIIILALYKDGTAIDLSDMVLSATMTDRDEATTTVTGTLTPDDGSFTWDFSAGDIGTSGRFSVIFTYTDGIESWASIPITMTIIANQAVTAIQNPPLIGVSTTEAAYLTSISATIPDPNDIATDADITTKQDKDTTSVTDNAAKFDADGNAIDAGFAFGTAAAADTGDFDASGSAAAAAAASVSKTLTALNTIVLLGDSITDANNAEGRNVGYFNWANALLGKRFNVVNYAGVGGNTTAQMLARLQTDVIDYNPDWCLVMGGANDIGQGVDSATIIENLEDIYTQLYDAGIRVIACTISLTISADSISKKEDWYAVDFWQKQYALSNKIILVDTAASYIDSTSSWPHPTANAVHDGVHPTALGAQRMGTAIASALDSLVRRIPQNVTGNGNDFGINANPMMGGTGGTFAGTGTGVAPDYWVVGDGTSSKVARQNNTGAGEWTQLEIDGGGIAQMYTNPYPCLSGFSVGDEIYGTCEVETDDDWVDPNQLSLEITFMNGGSILENAGALINHPNSGTIIENPGDCILQSDFVTVPDNCDGIRFRIYFAADAGTVRVSRASLVNIDRTWTSAIDESELFLAKHGNGVTLQSGYAEYDGTGTPTDLFSYDLSSQLDLNEISIITRLRVPAGDGSTERYFASINIDSGNYFRYRKSTANNLRLALNSTGQAAINKDIAIGDDTWYTIGATVTGSANEYKVFRDGSQYGATSSFVGTVTGLVNVNNFCVGGFYSYLGTVAWKGDISDYIISLNGANIASAANMATIHAGLDAGTLTTVQLDTIFGAGLWAWWQFTS